MSTVLGHQAGLGAGAPAQRWGHQAGLSQEQVSEGGSDLPDDPLFIGLVRDSLAWGKQTFGAQAAGSRRSWAHQPSQPGA